VTLDASFEACALGETGDEAHGRAPRPPCTNERVSPDAAAIARGYTDWRGGMAGVAGRWFIASSGKEPRTSRVKAALSGARAAHRQHIKTKNRREETACRDWSDWNPLSLQANAFARRM
jgi:hypothetical protein